MWAFRIVNSIAIITSIVTASSRSAQTEASVAVVLTAIATLPALSHANVAHNPTVQVAISALPTLVAAVPLACVFKSVIVPASYLESRAAERLPDSIV